MSESKSVSTPIEALKCVTGAHSSRTSEPYRELIGSLMYLVLGTRPDLAFAVAYLSRYQESPTNDNWTALKRILRYVQGTKDFKLEYQRNRTQENLTVYVDSDWASDAEDRKSTSGFLLKVHGNTVQWCSRKQAMVTLSSTETEYVAACAAAQEAVWLAKILVDLNVQDVYPIEIFEDITKAVYLWPEIMTQSAPNILT